MTGDSNIYKSILRPSYRREKDMTECLIDFGFINPIPNTRFYCSKCKLFLVLEKGQEKTECPICDRKMLNINTATSISTFRKSQTYADMKLKNFGVEK